MFILEGSENENGFLVKVFDFVFNFLWLTLYCPERCYWNCFISELRRVFLGVFNERVGHTFWFQVCICTGRVGAAHLLHVKRTNIKPRSVFMSQNLYICEHSRRP